jgi:small conductance mechanosensitive channel
MTLQEQLATPEFWQALYASGQFGSDHTGSILILVIVRALVIAAIWLGAAVLVKVAARVVKRALDVVSQRSEHSRHRLTTLYGLLTSTFSYIIYFVAILLVLFTCGISWAGLAPLLGAASVLGLAVGFGAQKLVRDVITGLFILGEGQFDAGEWVTIGAVTGIVEEIGLRVTRLRDEQGRIYLIANGDITQVFNASRGNVRLTVDVVLQRAGLDAALDVVRETAEGVLRDAQVTPRDGEAPGVLVTGMDAAKVTVRLVLWVPVLQKDAIEDALRRRLLAVETPALALA